MAEETGTCRRTCGNFLIKVGDIGGIETPVQVRHHNYLAGLFRVVFFVAYILFLFTAFNGFHEFKEEAEVVSALNVEIEGVLHSEDNTSIWDIPEYVVKKEVNSFAISSRLKKIRQNQTTCPEDPSVEAARCRNDSDCQPTGGAVPSGHGLYTGTCLEKLEVCEIFAWCPVENATSPPTQQMFGLGNITFTLRNWIKFVEFETSGQKYARNNFDDFGEPDPAHCLYHPDHTANKYCPRFQVETVLNATGEDKEDITKEGAIIGVLVNWDCNLDGGDLKYCKPDYSFKRLDQEGQGGWKLREDVYYGNNTRDLIKRTGIQFIVRVTGVGRRFDLGKTVVAIGGILSIFAAITSFCVLVVVPLISCGFKDFKKLSLVRSQEVDDLLPKDAESLLPDINT